MIGFGLRMVVENRSVPVLGLHRHGARHDIYYNPVNGCKQPVPRHNEIADTLARHILRYLGIEE